MHPISVQFLHNLFSTPAITAKMFDSEFNNFTMLITSLREQRDVIEFSGDVSLKPTFGDNLLIEFWSCMKSD